MEPSSGGCWAYVSGGPSGHSHCNQTCCCCFLRGDLWRSQINLISRVVRSRLSLTPISPLTHFLFNAYAKICTSLFETRGGHILIVSLLAELLVPKSCIDVCMWARVSTCANNVGVDIAGQGEDARIRRATDVGCHQIINITGGGRQFLCDSSKQNNIARRGSRSNKAWQKLGQQRRSPAQAYWSMR